MSEYKNTLNLPQTDFAMKANLPQREPTILQQWHDTKLYEKIREKFKGKIKFILPDGPPYANGHIHLGHAVNKVLKDAIIKSKTLSGYDATYVPGWDCHGLPIEVNVEKKHGKPGRKISAADFRHACREYVYTQIDLQRKDFMRLGVIGDWYNPYVTMDFTYEANIIRSLAKIVKNKHVQKGYKPVLWCLDCASSLAEAEVEYAEKHSFSIDVRFNVCQPSEVAKLFDVANHSVVGIPIWTTTPWTLPANEAVALNPLLDYAFVECNGQEAFIIADALVSSVMARYGKENYKVLNKIIGEKLVGVKLHHPFFAKEVPVVLGEHVEVESGTGSVHTAPAHGPDDFAIGKKFKLPLENPVGDDGCYVSTMPLFAGLHVSKVDNQILETLRAKGNLLFEAKIKHSYPHCWRHKTPVIYRATPQWFISMDKQGLRKETLSAINTVDWLPNWGLSRMTGMVDERPDWCISRQRAWGVPLAFFVHKETGELHPNAVELMEKVALQVEEQGIEAWHTLDKKELLGKDADLYQKAPDVLDVWFDSGVVHECVLKQRAELAFPADVFLEGSDQYRGWFQSSLLTSMAINNTAPYKEVLTHGFVVDGDGRKMSKSIGNVIAPDEVVQSLGADVLRLWVASIDYRNEITASKEILTRTSETYRRIRNTVRFFLANLHDFDPEQHLVMPQAMLALDKWAVDKARLVQNEILLAYDAYQFHTIVQKLHNFCVTDMGGFYLDVIKDRQYTMAKDSVGRRSAQTALYHIVHAFVRWIAPILSFTAEEIWQAIPGKHENSVFLTQWYDKFIALSADEFMGQTYWEKVRAVREAVNKEIERLRGENKLGSALEAEVHLYCGAPLKSQLEALGDELRFVLITSCVSVTPEHAGPLDAIVTEVPGLSLKVEATKHNKCVRCWHRREDVDANKEYTGLCVRCIENVAGSGEERNYV